MKSKIGLTLTAAAILAFTNTAFAKCIHHKKMAAKPDYKQETVVEPMIVWAPHWYAGANIGLGVTHDSPTTTGHVRNTGPGWSVDGGYQFTPIWGLEAGYTQFHNSEDDFGSVNIAYTEHHSAYLAATAQYPIPYCQRLFVLGKLGAAYSYARKSTPGGFFAIASSVSPYGALGFAVTMTPTIDFIGQWARSWGNHLTGSTDLWSVGLKVALI